MALARYVVADRRRRSVGPQRLSPSRSRPRAAASVRLANGADRPAHDLIDLGRYPGAIRLLIIVGLSIALWGLVLFIASAIVNLFQQR